MRPVTPFLTVCLALAFCAKASYAGPVLDGGPKSILVVGYSTSFQWPGVLQKMLDEHAGTQGAYTVLNASVGGSPVAKWLGMTRAEDREKTFDAMTAKYFDPGGRREGALKPSVALFQQSLQWVYGDRDAGIRGADDDERIEKGADAFEKLARQVHALGVADVYIATHIYKHPLEPGIENEKYALQALLERGPDYIHGGPDVWTPTKAVYPVAFRPDKLHPNDQGARIMAIGWYKTLAGAAAKRDIIQRAKQGAFDAPRARPGNATRSRGDFAERDADGNGYITPDEVADARKSALLRLDRDGDGKVTQAEYEANIGRRGGRRR